MSNIWNTHEELRAHLKSEWAIINERFGRGYTYDQVLSKEEFEEFCWVGYQHVVDKYYGGELECGLQNRGCMKASGYKCQYSGVNTWWLIEDGKRFHRITMSYRHYKDWGWDQMMDTLYHEIGHITYQGHGDDFWQEGRRIGYGLECEGWKPKLAKYRMYCPHCDNEHFYLSKPSRKYRCGSCFPDWGDWYRNQNAEFMIIEKYTGTDHYMD